MYQPLDMIPVKGLICLLYLTKCSLPWFSKERTHYDGEYALEARALRNCSMGVQDVKMQLLLYLTFSCSHEVRHPTVRYEELLLYRTSGSKKYSG